MQIDQEPAYYSPPASPFERQLEQAEERHYQDIRYALRDFKGALQFVRDWTDSDHVLATILMQWHAGYLKEIRDQLDSLVSGASRSLAEKEVL